MAAVLFVTGTDTGVGKTAVAAALISAFCEQELKVVGMKPVASGCRRTPEGFVSDDALTLMSQGNVAASYKEVNPYSFAAPMAPHLAAAQTGERIDLDLLRSTAIELARRCDVLVIEGAGGWLTPLNERQTLADLAVALGAQVVLVVGLRLGCINHSLLTVQAVAAQGLELAGWVANGIDPVFESAAANVKTLQQRLKAPLLGLIPHLSAPSPRNMAAYLDPRGISKLGLSL